MEAFESLIQNPILVSPLIAWFVAQILKTIIHTLFTKEFVAERMVGGGGMPSAHSATVCALVTATAIHRGFGSFEFAMATIFAIVTMYDAMGVRRETGRQGEVLNDMLDIFKKMGEKLGPEKDLKELIGHSPLQVTVGAILGVVISLLINHFMGYI